MESKINQDYLYPSDIAFTPTVKMIQERKGSRKRYAEMEQNPLYMERAGWQTEITEDLKSFIEDQETIFIATTNSEGQPYIQHKGGPKGFLKVIDEKTIAFVDYSGNRQYITQGNLFDNPKAHIFLIDYKTKNRIKIWGTARIEEDNHEEIEKYMPKNYKAIPEQVIYFTVTVWSPSCPQHIPSIAETI